MDILNHSLPQLYMGHYFKYLLLRYHSFVHFRQSKSYSMRLFEKNIHLYQQPHIVKHSKFASFAAQIRDFALSLWQLSEIDQKTWAQT